MKRRLLTLITASLAAFQLNAQLPGELVPMDSLVNSKYSEVRPTISADGNTLYFVVEGHPSNTMAKATKRSQDIWFSEKGKDGKWGAAKHASSVLNSQKSNAVFWVSPDGKKLLIRGAFENGIYVGRGVSITQFNGKEWSLPQRLKIKNYEKMAVDEFSGANLSANERTMFFYFSEEKNSFINDIYVSFLEEDNSWSQPLKLPAPINSPDYNEISPYLAPDGVTLYFSSDRPGGKGGHDIWVSKRIDESWKLWTEPKNVNYVNTSKWDAYFTIDASGEKAFIATTQNAKGGTDIATVKLDSTDRPQPVAIIYGNVYNAYTKEPLDLVLSYDMIPSQKNEGKVNTTPGTGSYKIVLPIGSAHRISASAEGFLPVSDTMDLTKENIFLEVHRDIYLFPDIKVPEVEEQKKEDTVIKEFRNPIVVPEIDSDIDPSVIKSIDSLKNLNPEVGMVIRLNNILFEFNKDILKAISFKELDKAVRLMKAYPYISIELSAHTDNVGSPAYNISLSNDRATAAAEYLFHKGIDRSRVIAKGYGESQPVTSNNTDEGRRLNRRVELKIIKKDEKAMQSTGRFHHFISNAGKFVGSLRITGKLKNWFRKSTS
jgi:outer membrane protein OmpA-like peptidoglycan-associated protein